MREAVATHAFYRLRVGRYLVAISLAEAEAARAAMHAAAGGRLPQAPRTELALRHGGEMLDASGGFLSHGAVARATHVSGEDYLSGIGEQCYRFLDSQLDYEPEALAMLLRALQSAPMRERLAAFVGVRHCRRRATADWRMYTIARPFTTDDECPLMTP